MNYIDEKLNELSNTYGYTLEELNVIGCIIAEAIIGSQMDTEIVNSALKWVDTKSEEIQ